MYRLYVCVCCFFFFFKQKTAYEMRISDWSSDVCSSDLGRRRPVGGGLPAVPARLWSDGAATRPRSRGLTPAWQARPRPASVRRDELGRASCRERVCQYV